MTIRLLHGYLRQGVKGSFDIGARDRSGKWVYLAKNLAYGQVTDYVSAPIGDGLNTFIWFIAPGDDPARYTIDDNAINFQVYPEDTGPHTLFMYYTDDVTSFAAQLISDGDKTIATSPGYPYVAYITGAIAGQFSAMDYGHPGLCFDRAKQNYYWPIEAGTFAFSIYDGSTTTNCQGSVVVSAPPINFAVSDVWMLYAMGDKANGYQLLPLKLTR
jgi:hypothetical protein